MGLARGTKVAWPSLREGFLLESVSRLSRGRSGGAMCACDQPPVRCRQCGQFVSGPIPAFCDECGAVHCPFCQATDDCEHRVAEISQEDVNPDLVTDQTVPR